MTDLLDTAPIRDQRTMVDVRGPEGIHRTIEDVEAAWERWATREGLPVRRLRGDWSTDLHRSRKTVQVYVSGGKWIGDCPECHDGIAGWPMHEHGCCLGCGTIYRLEYPSADEIPRIVELLQARPEKERHYNWHTGETLDDLAAANETLETEPAGVVAADEIVRVLGKRAYAKLQAEGLL
jgi:hypothetical protein